jgi:TolB-like protein/Flp pilus assembly protein TadD
MQAGLCEDIEEISNDMPSIAVLPFENMSGDPEQEYFCDGITASIVLSMGMFKGLMVKSQKSSFAFKHSADSSREIGEALDVDYLVEGNIRKSETKIRISVQLVESASGNQIWGKQYDTETADLLNLEQELSQTIAATISGRIGSTIQQSAARKPATDLKSYDYFLRGLHHFGKFTPDDLIFAIDQFEKCIAIDPDNAEAHMNLGMIHDIHLYEHWTADRDRTNQLANIHMRKAVELAPDNAMVHAYLSEHLLITNENGDADFHADRAIELNPNSSEAYAAKAQTLARYGRYDEAVECAERSVNLDPYSSGAAWVAGEIYLNAGQYEKSVKAFRSIETPPDAVRAVLAASLAGMGRLDQARKEMQHYLGNARRNMSDCPATREAWRELWQSYLPANFENFFELLLQAGLCDDDTEPGDNMPSIAVLPFENMSGDPEQEHFSDGITADLISTLFKFRNLRTVSFYSTQQYKSQKASIAEIAAQQRVRYILKGSVRKSGDRIRVNVELIDSSNEQILWSERFDRDLDNMFTVQDEITRSIALAMKVQLDDGEMALHRSKGVTSIRAWELTLTAADLQDTHIRQNVLDSRVMAMEAIEIDPEYAFAWITLAWAYWVEAYDGWSDSIDDSIAEAEKANLRARSIDPDYGEAWIQAGMIYLMKHEPEESIAACLKAVELEPGNTEIHALTAYAYIVNGEYEKARDHDQNATRLCPIRPGWYYLGSGLIEQHTGNPIKAAEFYRKGLEVEPGSPISRYFLIDVEMELGNDTHALQLANEVKKLDRSVTARGIVHGYSYDPGQRERFRANLAKFDLA